MNQKYFQIRNFYLFIIFLFICFMVVVTNNLFLNQTRTSLDVPEPEKGTYMAVPISLTSDQSDIECQVVPTISKVGQCISLENRCGGRFTESIYTKFIQICNISSHLKICFSNVTEEIHNMPIHFFYSLSPWCTSTESRQPLRLYIASYKIVFEGIVLLLVCFYGNCIFN